MAAELLLEEHHAYVRRVVRIRRDPHEVVVLYVNDHNEPRTAFITAVGVTFTIHVVTGFA
jgi:hypothetical protein